MKSITAVLFFTVLLTSATGFSQAMPESMSAELDSTGSEMRAQRAFEVPGEIVNTRTGHVSYRNIEAKIPGPNGLDITMARVFGSDTSLEQIAYGWDLDLPRLDSLVACSSTTLNFTVSIPGQDPMTFGRNGAFPISANFVSSEKWTVVCGGATNRDFVVRSPDGLKYYFTFSGTNQATRCRAVGRGDRCTYHTFASELSNQFGDWIRYSYRNVPLNTAYNDRNTQITGITSSDGRFVSFSQATDSFVDRFGRQVSRSFITGWTAQNRISYQYNSYPSSSYDSLAPVCGYGPPGPCVGSQGTRALGSVTRPDGLAWSYQYTGLTVPSAGMPAYVGSALSRVISPTGLQIDYTYGFVPANYFTAFTSALRATIPNQPVLTSRTLSGPGLISPIAITYLYYVKNFPMSAPYAPTGQEATYPTGDLVSYTFEIFGNTVVSRRFRRDDLVSSSPTNWKQGLLEQQSIFPKPPFTLEDSVYNYVQGLNSECQTPAVQGNCRGEVRNNEYVKTANWGVSSAMPILARPLNQSAVYRSTGTSVYKANGFTVYGSPTGSTEYRVGGALVKSTSLNYFTSPTYHILELPQSTSVQGIGGTSKSYSDQGQLLKESTYGVTKQFSYLPTGELYEEFLVRGSVPVFTVRHEDYYRGVSRVSTKASGAVVRRVVDDLGRITSESDGAGNITSFAHDGMGRVVSAQPPVGSPATTVFPSALITVTTRGSNRTATYFDCLERELRGVSEDLMDPSIRTIHSVRYDENGQRSFSSSVSSVEEPTDGTLFQYDVIGRLTQTTLNANNAITRYSYLPNLTVVVAKPLGTKFRANYESYADPQQLYLIKMQTEVVPNTLDADPGQTVVTNITRDVLGKLLTVEQEGFVRTYTYDAAQRLVQVKEPEKNTEVMSYVPGTTLVATRRVGAMPMATLT
ncbi:MAG: hypothetical protein EOP06_01215, partial [Proteobacteria bacterium]